MTALNLKFVSGVPFVSGHVTIEGQTVFADWLFLDTGSGAMVFRTEVTQALELQPLDTARVRWMSGVGGGEEPVVERPVKSLKIGEFVIENFTIQIGALQYGFGAIEIDGLIGSDFLRHLGLVIDYGRGELRKDS